MTLSRASLALCGFLLALASLAACAGKQSPKDANPPQIENSTGIATADPVKPGATVAPAASSGLPAMPAYK